MNCEKLIYAELNEAELLLKGHKAERESRGEITRGELRGIIIELEEPKHSLNKKMTARRAAKPLPGRSKDNGCATSISIWRTGAPRSTGTRASR